MEIGWFVCSVIETVDPAVGHQALKPKSKPISQRMMINLPFFQMIKENNFHQRKWCFSHRWQLYVRRRSIPGLLWIPGSLYVRVCMAICVSAIRPNKHPQTVGNLWPPILEEENSFKTWSQIKIQNLFWRHKNLCCFLEYLTTIKTFSFLLESFHSWVS